MGRYQAKKRQEEQAKTRAKREEVKYTTGRSRGGQGNRRLVRSPKPKRGLSNIPPKEGTGRGSPNDKNLKPIPASQRPKDMQAGRVYGDAGQPKAPKLPPKPTPSRTAPKPAEKKPESGKKLTPMQQWAKANPKLAAKVKKGQSGYKELKIGRSTKPRNWLEKNYKHGKK